MGLCGKTTFPTILCGSLKLIKYTYKILITHPNTCWKTCQVEKKIMQLWKEYKVSQCIQPRWLERTYFS